VLLATYVQGRLVYAGRAGSGITAAVERELLADFERLPAAAPPLEAPDEKDSRWVAPRLVAEVRYKQRSPHGLLRMPVFVRLRTDKSPEECGDSAVLAAPAPGPVAISNPDKLLWPKDKISKADLVAYYRSIAPYMLPYLADRAVTLVRYPDGIDEEAFFQKNAPPNTPDWLRVEPIASDDKVTDYLVLESEEALAYVANLAAVELHVRNATISSPDRPTWFNIDLDPKTAPFAWVVASARAVLRICDTVGLPAFLKTTGSTGLHVLFPGGGLNHMQGELLCQLIARLVHQELPEKTTMERVIERRGGRVYLDCGQNRAGTTIAAPYSVRARPGASVSMPITRRELGKPELNRQFHCRNALKRVRSRREDPLLALLSCDVDMAAAIGAIDARWSGDSAR
jgi:bifunctional non-homologous end joining protein LigD